MKARLQSSRLFVYLVIGLIVSEIIVACAGEITTPQYALAVTGVGTGSGSVTSSPSGIDCSIIAGGARDDCTAAYDENTLVTLTAAADVGSTFDGWSGTCNGTGTCQVTMTQARSVTARFELIPPPQYQLTVAGAGTGSGGVTGDQSLYIHFLPPGIAVDLVGMQLQIRDLVEPGLQGCRLPSTRLSLANATTSTLSYAAFVTVFTSTCPRIHAS